jgi:23S rRNA pseudouridine955/2504/2580 synthase
MKFKFPHIQYERLQQSIRKGDIKVNSLKSEPQTLLYINDKVTIWDKLIISDDSNIQVQPKFWENIKIIEQNADFWVIDKPYGVPTQGGTNIKISLVDILHTWMGTKPYIVHRLDRQTTGVFVVATNSYAARDLSDSLKKRLWNKVYHGLVAGEIEKKSGTIKYPVFGRDGITKFRLVRYEDGNSLVEFMPITGRRHQIRQHAAKFLAPLVGDEIYGEKSKKMYLRCVELEIEFRGQRITFVA